MGVVSDKTARWVTANIMYRANQPEWALLFYHDQSPNQYGASAEQWEDEALKVVGSLTETDTELPEPPHSTRDAVMAAFVHCWSLRQQGHGVGRLLTDLEFLLEECASGNMLRGGNHFRMGLPAEAEVLERGIVHRWRGRTPRKPSPL